MLFKFNRKRFIQHLLQYTKILIGDWLVIIASFIAVIILFQQFWTLEQASQLKIRQGSTILGTYDLNQTRELHIKGPKGTSVITIQNGKARYKKAPCNNQYCVHQGWLNRAGQVAICIPNQISLQLIGAKPSYDSLNY